MEFQYSVNIWSIIVYSGIAYSGIIQKYSGILKNLAYSVPELFSEPWHVQKSCILRATGIFNVLRKCLNGYIYIYLKIITIFAISAFHVLYFIK